jgi:methyl-accepting chemotaxis protein
MSGKQDGRERRQGDRDGGTGFGSIREVSERVRRSYLLKFATALLVIVAIIGVVGYAVQAQAAETLESDVEKQLEEEVEKESQQLSEDIAGNDKRVLMAADHPSIADEAKRQEYITAVLDEQMPERATAIHVVNAIEQEIVASTDKSRIGENARDTQWGPLIGGADAGKVSRTDPFEKANGETVIVALTVSPEDLQLMVVVEFSASGLSEQFSSGIDGTFTTVVRPTTDGTEVLFSNYPGNDTTFQPYVENRSVREIPELNQSTVNGTFRSDMTKESELEGDWVGSYAKVEGTDWVIIKHAPASNAFALRQNVRQGILVFMGIALVGVVAVGGTIGRNTASAVKELSRKSQIIEDGHYEVEVESDRTDEIGQLFDSIGSMRDTLVDRLQEAEKAREEATDAKQNAETARAEAEAAREEAEALNQQMVEKAESFGAVMADCADGDLTRRMDTDADIDAMVDIAEAFNQMLDQWEKTILTIRDFATEVDESSADASESVREIRDASAEVSSSTQTMTETLQEQDEHVEDVSREMSDLSATIEEITSTAESVADRAQKTAERGETGQRAAESALDDLEAIQTQTNVTVETVEELAGRMDEIDEIVEFITDIAEQTNILALNANIEAARAGAAGSGFAVVASEVKDLAEETKTATEEIEAVVSEIREQTETTVDDMAEVSERVDDGTMTVEEALNALDEIAEQARETNHGVQEIRNATNEQANAAQDIARFADEVAELSERTTAETENVAASAQEQAASIDEISDEVSHLSTRAGALHSEMEEFDVDGGERVTAESDEETAVTTAESGESEEAAVTTAGDDEETAVTTAGDDEETAVTTAGDDEETAVAATNGDGSNQPDGGIENVEVDGSENHTDEDSDDSQ